MLLKGFIPICSRLCVRASNMAPRLRSNCPRLRSIKTDRTISLLFVFLCQCNTFRRNFCVPFGIIQFKTEFDIGNISAATKL